MKKFKLKSLIIIIGLLLASTTAFAQNNTTTSKKTIAPTSPAALTIYPIRTNPTILDIPTTPITNTNISDTTTTPPSNSNTTNITTTPPPNSNITTTKDINPTQVINILPHSTQSSSTTATPKACPSTPPLQSQSKTTCAAATATTTFLPTPIPWIPLGATILGVLLFSIIMVSLFNSRNHTLSRFAARAESINYQNNLNKKSLDTSRNMFDFLTTQIGTNKLDHNSFNKIASQLEIIGPPEIRKIIPKLKQAFLTNDTKKLADLTAHFKNLLKNQIKN